MRVKTRERLLALSLLLCHTAMLVYVAATASPTFDEVAYLPAGISHWEFGRFELYRASPHLVRVVAALPVLALDPATDWRNYVPTVGGMPEFSVGKDFMAANGASAGLFFFVARLACIPFSLLGAIVCFYWARQLFGRTAGLVALAIWCFEPNIIGHGALFTSDVATASLSVLVLFLASRWLKHLYWSHAVDLGIALGLLLLTRSNAVLLIPFLLLFWLSMLVVRGWRQVPVKSQVGQLLCATTIALVVLNAGYAFSGSFRTLGSYRFASKALRGQDDTSNRFAGTAIASLPVPLPADYVLGIDTLKRNFENNMKLMYLGGTFQTKGWWYYYLYGLAVKVPLSLWGLLILNCLWGWRYRTKGLDEPLLLIAAVAYLAFISSQTGLNSHVRYALPIAPLLIVWISRLAVAWRQSERQVAMAVVVGLLWLVTSTIRILPYNLSYFNEVAGGPLNGANHLLDSNIDWGQDLYHLRRWLSDHAPDEPVHIAYFGSYTPADIGIPFRLPPRHVPVSERSETTPSGPIPGLFAISVNFLRGYRFFLFDEKGNRQTLNGTEFTYFQKLKPIGRAGYSIYVYRLSLEDAERLRKELEYPALSQSDSK